jgi:hypothetical protein
MRLFVLLFVPALVFSCPLPDDCTPNETRCSRSNAQICGSDQRWRTYMNCSDLGGTMIDWTCCWSPGDELEGVPAGHTCLQGTACPGGEP